MCRAFRFHPHAGQTLRRIDPHARATSAPLCIVVVHQPAAGADIAMGGHIHVPYVLPLSGLARPMWAAQAGTAVSSRARRGVPNSVNLLRWGADSNVAGCTVEQWDYSDAKHAFIRTETTQVKA